MLKTLFIDLKKNVKKEKSRQVITLYLVNIIGIPLGIITSIVLTRFLGSSGYGDYVFLNNIFNFSMIIFTFGFFQAGNRALVLNNDLKIGREIYGAVFVFLTIVFLLMAATLYVYGYFDNNLTTKGLRKIFFYLVPFSWIYLLINYFEVLFQADNKINLLAITRLFPKIGFFIVAGFVHVFLFSYKGNRLSLIWALYLITYLLVFLFVIKKINISFRNLKLRMVSILEYNKSYGFDIYIGSLFAVGFSTLTGILISYFGADNSGVGNFGLAVTFSTPLSLIPNVIATTHYKAFSTSSKMPQKLILITAILSIAALLLIWIVVGPFIRYFYGNDFISVIFLNFLITIGVVFHGFADFFNRFLGAHGEGKSIRNSAILIGAIILIFNVILIPNYGEYGAAITKIISGILYFIFMIYYYKKLVRNLADKIN